MNSGDVRVDQAARDGRLGFTRAFTFSSDDLPQVVDRVEIDVLERSDGRVDVARHGEVEHEHRPMPPLLSARRTSASEIT